MKNKIIFDSKIKGRLFLLKGYVFSLNIRKDPDPNNKKNIIGVISNKYKPVIVATGEVYKREDGGVWYKVTKYDTIGVSNMKKTGWINSAYVRKLN